MSRKQNTSLDACEPRSLTPHFHSFNCHVHVNRLGRQNPSYSIHGFLSRTFLILIMLFSQVKRQTFCNWVPPDTMMLGTRTSLPADRLYMKCKWTQRQESQQKNGERMIPEDVSKSGKLIKKKDLEERWWEFSVTSQHWHHFYARQTARTGNSNEVWNTFGNAKENVHTTTTGFCTHDFISMLWGRILKSFLLFYMQKRLEIIPVDQWVTATK